MIKYLLNKGEKYYEKWNRLSTYQHIDKSCMKYYDKSIVDNKDPKMNLTVDHIDIYKNKKNIKVKRK